MTRIYLFCLLAVMTAVPSHAMSVLDTGVRPDGCCAKLDFSSTIGNFVLSIPCVQYGNNYYTLELTWNGSGFSLFNYMETQGSCASNCTGANGGGGNICADCSCPDFARAHPLECGQTGRLNFRLTWKNSNDVDLRVVYDSGQNDNGEIIWYNNKTGEKTGGMLDVDANADCSSNVTNRPVENIFFEAPPAGIYTMKVCGYQDCGNGDTSVTAQVLVNGTVVKEKSIVVKTWNGGDSSCTDVFTYTVN